MTDLIKKDAGSLAARLQSKANALVSSASSVSNAGMAGVAYMRFSKFGDFTYGPDHIEVEKDSTWAVNLDSCVHGWQAWSEAGKPVGDLMVSAFEPLPLESDLPDVDGDWNKSVGFMLACVTGEDKGTVVLFKTNSVGGRDAYRDLINTAVAHLSENPEEVVPLVKLENSFYIHDKYGKIFKPVFEVDSYGTAELLGDDSAAAVEKATEDAKADAAEEEAPVEEKPARTRKSRRQRVS